MRLQDGQIEAITEVVRQFAGDTSRVFLFGSRTRDGAKGGDVDLLVETVQEMPRLQRARMKMALEAALDLPVDLVVRPESTPPTAFERLARRQAIPLAKEVTAR